MALTASGLVVDQALFGLLRGGTQLARNSTLGIVKLVLIILAVLASVGDSSVVVYGTWVLGLLASMFYIVGFAATHERRLRACRPDVAILRHLGRGMGQHHALNMAIQAPSLAMPVMVASIISAEAAGYFYSASMVAVLVAVVDRDPLTSGE